MDCSEWRLAVMMNLCFEEEQSRHSLVKSTFTLLSDFRENLSIKMRSAEEMDQALILFSSLCAHHTSVHTTFYFSWILIDIKSPSHHQADVELRETILKVGNNSKPTFGSRFGLSPPAPRSTSLFQEHRRSAAAVSLLVSPHRSCSKQGRLWNIQYMVEGLLLKVIKH